MEQRRFGRTNHRLSIASLGTMRCLASPAILTATVHRAYERGINHLETAQGYGNSEVYLGQALRTLAPRDRDNWFLTTKIPPCPDAATMARQIDVSLRRLQVERLDHLALHGVNTGEHLAWLRAETGCMSAIQDAIAAGKIGYVGFSTHGALELILETIATGYFAFVNLHYYYFWQRHALAIAAAADRDMGILIISPADKGGWLHRPSASLETACAPLSPLEFTYRFLLREHRLTTLSMGPANPAELDGAIAQVPTPPYWGDREAQIHQRLSAQRRENLRATACEQCYACLPCPEAIHIPEVLRLRNLAIAHGLTPFAQYRYQMFENAGHWFPGRRGDRCTDCGECLPRCPTQLPIPDLLRDAHERLRGRERRRLWQD